MLQQQSSLRREEKPIVRYTKTFKTWLGTLK